MDNRGSVESKNNWDDCSDWERPKKTNSRKSMVPLFVYLILKEKTDTRRHLSQKELMVELEKFPYEVSVERKALSRTIHGLADSGLGIVSDLRDGVWFDSDHVWAY